jgi:hypothetical protein
MPETRQFYQIYGGSPPGGTPTDPQELDDFLESRGSAREVEVQELDSALEQSAGGATRIGYLETPTRGFVVEPADPNAMRIGALTRSTSVVGFEPDATVIQPPPARAMRIGALRAPPTNARNFIRHTR